MASWLFPTAFCHSLQGYFGSAFVRLGPGLVSRLKLLVPLAVYCTLEDKKRLARCLKLRFEQTVEMHSRTKGNVEPFGRAIETCFFLVRALSRIAGTIVIKISNSFIELVHVGTSGRLVFKLQGEGVRKVFEYITPPSTFGESFLKLFNQPE